MHRNRSFQRWSPQSLCDINLSRDRGGDVLLLSPRLCRVAAGHTGSRHRPDPLLRATCTSDLPDRAQHHALWARHRANQAIMTSAQQVDIPVVQESTPKIASEGNRRSCAWLTTRSCKSADRKAGQRSQGSFKLQAPGGSRMPTLGDGERQRCNHLRCRL